MKHMAIGLGALTLSALAACASDTTRPGHASDPMDGGDSGSGSEPTGDAAENGDSPDENTLPVRIEASAESVCPGACATLSVRVSDAAPTPAQTLAWSDAAELNTASREVCPTGSTTYHVEVREAPDTSLEFAQEAKRGGADITLSLRDDCDDAGQPTQQELECSYRIPIALPEKGIVNFHGYVKQDAMGNMYLGAEFTGKVSIAGKTYGADSFFGAGNADVLLAKFDSTCKLLWAKQFEGDGQFTNLFNFDVGLDGTMALITWDRSYDIFLNQEVHNHLYVLDANGDPKWNRLGGGGEPQTPQTFDFGPDGALAVASVDACTDGYGDCVGVFHTDGSVRHTYRVPDASSVGVAFDPGGNLVIAGVGGLGGTADDDFAYVTFHGPDGAQRWTRQIATDSTEQITTIEARAIFTSNGDILSPRLYGDPQGQHLHVWRIDALGTTVENQDHVQPEAAGWAQYVWPLVDGTYAMMGTRQVMSTGVEPEQKVFLQRRQADGTLLLEKDVSVGKFSSPGAPVVPGPDGALGFAVIEMQGHSEATGTGWITSGLVVKRIGW